MYHSITFGTKNTWTDWHLIPASRPVVSPPSVKTTYVEIPGGDGSIDLSTALAGRPLYNDRSGSFQFYVENGHGNWFDIYYSIMTYLHGQKMRMVLEDDPRYYYEGRFSVSGWQSGASTSAITINYVLSPYKYEINQTGEGWIWDAFNFSTDHVRAYSNLSVNGTLAVSVYGGMTPVVPTIVTSTSGMSVSFGGTSYSLVAGNNVLSAIVLQQGANILTFSGTGTVSIKYTGVSL